MILMMERGDLNYKPLMRNPSTAMAPVNKKADAIMVRGLRILILRISDVQRKKGAGIITMYMRLGAIDFIYICGVGEGGGGDEMVVVLLRSDGVDMVEMLYTGLLVTTLPYSSLGFPAELGRTVIGCHAATLCLWICLSRLGIANIGMPFTR